MSLKSAFDTLNNYLLELETSDIGRFEKELFEFVDTKYPEIPAAIKNEKVISDATEEVLKKAIKECIEEFKA